MAYGDKTKFIQAALGMNMTPKEVISAGKKAGLTLPNCMVYGERQKMGQAGYTNGNSPMALMERLTALRANIRKMQAEEKTLIASIKKTL